MTTFIQDLEYSPPSHLSSQFRDENWLSTHNFRNCSVSITLRDVQFGRLPNPKDPTVFDEACIVYLIFEFSQSRGQRIKEATFHVDFLAGSGGSAAAPPEPQKRSLSWLPSLRKSSSPAPRRNSVFKIVAREPLAWIGTEKDNEATRQVGLEGNLASINVKYELSQSYKKSEAMSVRSMGIGDVSVRWDIKELGLTQSGFPQAFQCASILRTGGKDFGMRVRVHCSVGGGGGGGAVMIPAKAKDLVVGPEFFNREDRLVDPQCRELLQNMESDEFKAAVRSVVRVWQDGTYEDR